MGGAAGKSSPPVTPAPPEDGAAEAKRSEESSKFPSSDMIGVWSSSKLKKSSELWQTGNKTYDVYAIQDEAVWATITVRLDGEDLLVELVNKMDHSTKTGKFKLMRSQGSGDQIQFADGDVWVHRTKSFEVGPTSTLMIVPLENTTFQKCIKSTFSDRRMVKM